MSNSPTSTLTCRPFSQLSTPTLHQPTILSNRRTSLTAASSIASNHLKSTCSRYVGGFPSRSSVEDVASKVDGRPLARLETPPTSPFSEILQTTPTVLSQPLIESCGAGDHHGGARFPPTPKSTPYSDSTIPDTGRTRFANDRSMKIALRETSSDAMQGGPCAPARPVATWATIIAQAIMSTPEKRARLNTIYDKVTEMYPFFGRTGPGSAAWRNAVRHNLSVGRSRSFFRVSGPHCKTPGRGDYWAVRESVLSFFPPTGPLIQVAQLRSRRQISSTSNPNGSSEPITCDPAKAIDRSTELLAKALRHQLPASLLESFVIYSKPVPIEPRFSPSGPPSYPCFAN